MQFDQLKRATVRPSVQPSSRKRCTKAGVHCLVAFAVDETKYSMVGSFAGCCARAASGVAAAPPSQAINSRRARPRLAARPSTVS